MPVLRVYGLEETSRAQRMDLIQSLKFGVSMVQGLGVTPDGVTPLIDTQMEQEVPGEKIVVFVDGLFDKDERTPKVRQKLTDQVFLYLHLFLKRHNLQKAKSAQVIIYRIKPEEGVYTSGDIQKCPV